MQAMIGKDAVLLLINHRIGMLMEEYRLSNCHRTVVGGQIRVLEELKMQLDFIQPLQIEPGNLTAADEPAIRAETICVTITER